MAQYKILLVYYDITYKILLPILFYLFLDSKVTLALLLNLQIFLKLKKTYEK